MICYPNAKINLGLKIISKRVDGLHNISSFFLPVPLYDILELHASSPSLKKIKISYSGIHFPKENQDLVLKAYKLLNKDFKLPAVQIHLHKNIPFGAGLGGGSSDAAFMLLMLNNQFNLGLNKSDLLDYAMTIGSDCPFFLINNFSHVSGFGQHIQPIDYPFKNYHVVIVKPVFHASTRMIFANFKLNKNNKSKLNFDKNPHYWKTQLVNDLESVTFLMCPELKNIKNKLYSLGAVYASMSGSGSSIYGLFKTKPNIKNQFNHWVWQGDLSKLFK